MLWLQHAYVNADLRVEVARQAEHALPSVSRVIHAKNEVTTRFGVHPSFDERRFNQCRRLIQAGLRRGTPCCPSRED
jgi:hypothetical protein